METTAVMQSDAPPHTRAGVKRKALVLAEAANPEWVSVPLVGWSMANALRGAVDAHIVTQVRNRDAMVRAGLVEGDDFTAIDSEKIAAPAYKAASILRGGSNKGWTTLSALNAFVYPYFERLVWEAFGDDIEKGRFDIVHRVTPLSLAMQSPIARKCRRAGVPFVIGPLNGGVPWPKGYEREQRKEREWLSSVRSAYKLLPGRDATLACANAIIVGSRITATDIPAAYRDKVVYMPENGVDPSRFNMTVLDYGKEPLRACFIGRLVPCKGVDMLIEAAAPLMRDGRMTLDIIGDGPLRGELETLIAREDVAAATTMRGWVEHKDLQSVATQSSVLAFPSVRDFGGGVVLEAMAMGLVPLVVDYAGPGELVAPGTGYKAPVGPREALVPALREKLELMLKPATDLRAVGERARAYAFERFAWRAKAADVARIYDWAMGEGPKPDLFPA